MELGGDLPTLVVLDVDETARQHEVLVAGVFEMGGKRIEPFGDHFELPHRRTTQASLVIAALEVAKPLGEAADGSQDLRQRQIKHEKDCSVHGDGKHCQLDQIVPSVLNILLGQPDQSHLADFSARHLERQDPVRLARTDAEFRTIPGNRHRPRDLARQCG